MDHKNLKRLQKISHRTNRDRTEVAHEFVTGLKAALAKRGYRADLHMSTNARSTSGRFAASVAFDPQLGHPSEEDLLSIVAQSYPTHDIDWELAEVDSEVGAVLLSLHPSTEIIPIKSIKEIPPEFVSIGAAIYKRAIDVTGNAQEVWTLKRTEDGLALYRSHDDMEILADDDEGLKAGDVADTPYGPGRIIRFDELGNALVQIGNMRRFVTAADMVPYKQEKEKQKLTDYYAEAYGDKEFAKALTEKYDKVKKPKDSGSPKKSFPPSDMKKMVHK